MVRKLILMVVFMATTINSSFAQDTKVELKDDVVFLDAKQLLKYEKINFYQYSFYSLDNDEEIILYKYNENETHAYSEDDYYVINFLKEKIKVETKDLSKISSISNSKKSMEKLIKWLLKEKVLTTEGKIDKEKLETFFSKYDENITARTIRQ